MSIGEVKSTIARGSRAADQARVTMLGVSDQINEAIDLAGTTHGSGDESVARGHARLREAIAEARRVVRLLGSSVESADEYRGVLE